MPLSDAELLYRSGSGCAPGGQTAVLLNRLIDRPINVTLGITTTISGESSTNSQVIPLEPAGEQSVGCTIEGAMPPYIYNRFEILAVIDG